MSEKQQTLLYKQESYLLRGLWIDIHKTLGPGHTEVTYGNAFEKILKEKNIPFVREPHFPLSYNGQKVGNYRPDFVVFGKIIIEFKSLSFISDVFVKKLDRCLAISDYRLAFIVNFGASKTQIIRRIHDQVKQFQHIQRQSSANSATQIPPRSQRFLRALSGRPDGQLALLSLLIIGAITLAAALSASFISRTEIGKGFRQSQIVTAQGAAESCLEEALYRLKSDSNYEGGQVTIGEGTCVITIINDSATVKSITVIGSLDKIRRKIEAKAQISPFKVLSRTEAVTDAWHQTDWGGGVSSAAASHNNGDQTGWTKYESENSAGKLVFDNGEVKMALSPASWTQTNDTTEQAGFNFTGNGSPAVGSTTTATNTQVNGSGASANVLLRTGNTSGSYTSAVYNTGQKSDFTTASWTATTTNTDTFTHTSDGDFNGTNASTTVSGGSVKLFGVGSDGSDGSPNIITAVTWGTYDGPDADVTTDGISTYIADNSATAGSTSITVASGTGFYNNDEILIIQDYNATTPSDSGIYEFHRLAANGGVSGNTLTFITGETLANAYYGTASTAAGSKVQVLRVPNYAGFTIGTGGSVTASKLDINGDAGNSYTPASPTGTGTGGIVAFWVNGLATIGGSGIIASNKGFPSEYFGSSAPSIGYSAGFGPGAGGKGTNCGTPGGKGGGGGGGAGYSVAGTAGYDNTAACTNNGAGSDGQPGVAGSSYGTADLSRLDFGSSGGGGGWDYGSGRGGRGGGGGGIVFIGAGILTINAAISAGGEQGQYGDGSSPAGGGGGSGGSVNLQAVGLLTLGNDLVTAAGGGASAGATRNGGAGSTGRIAIVYGSYTGTTNPAFSASVLSYGYLSSGTYTSLPKEVGSGTKFGTMFWTSVTPTNTVLTIKVQSCSAFDCSDRGVNDWSTVSSSGSNIGGEALTYVTDGHGYIRYKADMTSNGAATPSLDDVTINTIPLVLEARAGNTADLSAVAWTEIGSGVTASSNLSTTFDGNQYIQYRAKFSTTNTAYSPSLDDITINYQYYPIGGEYFLVSSKYDTGDATSAMEKIQWTEYLPATGDIQFQIRSSNDGSTWTQWCGPTACDDTAKYTDPYGTEAIFSSLADNSNDRWFQYKVFLTNNDISDTPILKNAHITYELSDKR